jgi:hypothetical protein
VSKAARLAGSVTRTTKKTAGMGFLLTVVGWFLSAGTVPDSVKIRKATANRDWVPTLIQD